MLVAIKKKVIKNKLNLIQKTTKSRMKTRSLLNNYKPDLMDLELGKSHLMLVAVKV
jgi:hypothetical protein